MWLTIKELSAYIKIKEKTIYYLVKQGTIPNYRINKMIRFKISDIDQWMESKKADSIQKQVDHILKSAYTPLKGKPGRLIRKVVQNVIQKR